MNHSNWIKHVVAHDTLNEGSIFQPEHRSFLKCHCTLSAQLRETEVKIMSEESPLDALTREEFMEIFNSKTRFHVNTPGEDLIARRQRLMRFIAKFRTEVHAIDEVVSDRKKRGSAKEKEALREADKKYRRKIVLEDTGMKESTGDKILDSLIKMFGSKDAALAHLKSLQAKSAPVK